MTLDGTAVQMWLQGALTGLLAYAVLRVLLTGFYVVNPTQRAVVTSFGRARRRPGERAVDLLEGTAQQRYVYPAVEVVGPGGPYFKWPWQRVHKVDVATQAVDLTWDPSKAQTSIEAVTKDHLTIGVRGQLRYRVSENNLYAYIFGIQSPLEHVMGYFVSILRERIATFADPLGDTPRAEAEPNESPTASPSELSEGVSINDLRKNLPQLNQFMEQQCRDTAGRYGIELDAALITEIEPPVEVDSALAAINSTRNQVAADISTARAEADQQTTMAKQAVQIAKNNAEAEVAPLQQLAAALLKIKQQGGPQAIETYLRNMRIPLIQRAHRIVHSAIAPKGSKCR